MGLEVVGSEDPVRNDGKVRAMGHGYKMSQ